MSHFNKCASSWSPIYKPSDRPMSVAVFASGGGGNLRAAIALAAAHPSLLSVDIVVTDRLGIPAIEIANSHGIHCVSLDFEKMCGKYSEVKNSISASQSYRTLAENFHSIVLARINEFEDRRNKAVDLAVLSYRRIITGPLFAFFKDRMINQHPADLSILSETGARKYTGISGLELSIREGQSHTRTSTILVREGVDDGEIICQGPRVQSPNFAINRKTLCEHENRQKELSDWPSLRFALTVIAEGRLGIAEKKSHGDGSRVLVLDSNELPYGGVSL